MIALAAERFTKNLWTDRESSRSVRSWSAVRERPTRPATSSSACWKTARKAQVLKQQAVLFRTSHHSGPLEIELTRRNIPFVKFGGLKFLDAAHVKDMLAVLRFVENPRDRVAGFRIMQLLPGVGPSSAQRVLDLMAEQADPLGPLSDIPAPPRRWRGLEGVCANAPDHSFGNGRLARRDRQRVAGMIRISNAFMRMRPCATPTCSSSSRSPQAIPHGRAFLTELTLDPPDATSDQAGVPVLDEDYLILSTIPFRQGAGMEIGLRAQRRRRLHSLRSRDRNNGRNRGGTPAALCRDDTSQGQSPSCRAAALFHTWPEPQGDRHVYAARTRFIPAALLPLFECRTWPIAVAAPDQADPRQVRLDVGARMRSMWR